MVCTQQFAPVRVSALSALALAIVDALLSPFPKCIDFDGGLAMCSLRVAFGPLSPYPSLLSLPWAFASPPALIELSLNGAAPPCPARPLPFSPHPTPHTQTLWLLPCLHQLFVVLF